MAPRALGALFALVAALLFATALAGGLVPKVVPGWWDGHPVVQGRELELKAIHVGLLGAYGCNLGGEIKCEELDTNHSLVVVSIAEMAALGLGAFTALLLAISAARIGERRKLLARLLLFEILLISAGAATIFIHGPDLRISIQVLMPVGIGLMAVGAGVGSALLATIAAFRVRREPLRLKPSQSVIQQQQTRQAQQPAFDVRELLREGQGGTPQAPAGNPGLGQVQTHTPLFESAPALRPLYDMQNAGAAPGLAPIYTPPPRDQPTAPRASDKVTPGDSASAHVPVAAFVGADPFAPVGGGGRFGAPGELFAQSPARQIDQTEDLEHELGSQPAMPPPMAPTTIEMPTTSMRGRASPAPPRPPRPTGSLKTRVPAPERGARSTKHPTLAAAVPPPPVYNDLPETSTAVEVDADAKARYQARLESATDAPTTHRRSERLFDKSENMISAPLAQKNATTDQCPLGGGEEATEIFSAGPAPSDATNETLSAPEQLDDATNETLSAPEKLDEERHAIGIAHTELAPLLTQQQLADLPSSEQPPIEPPPPLPQQRERAARLATRPFGRTEPPAQPAQASAPQKFPPAKASNSLPPPSRPGPPPKPTSLPPASAPVAAPFSPRDSAPTIGIERVEPELAGSQMTRTPSLMDASAFSTPRRVTPDPSAPAAPFPVAPSAAHVTPIMMARAPLAPLAAKNGPVTASRGSPSPRAGRASVPSPASTSNASNPTSTAPSPFATIPSPFAAKVPPSRPSDEALTRRVEKGLFEAPTASATPEHHAAVLAEAATQPSPVAIAPTRPTRPTRPTGPTRPTRPTLPPTPRFEISTPGDEVATVHAAQQPAACATPDRSASTTVQPRATPTKAAEVPISTAPSSLPPPKKSVASGPTPACPQCEAPMAWVEEHLRFYCASCRMYF